MLYSLHLATICLYFLVLKIKTFHVEYLILCSFLGSIVVFTGSWMICLERHLCTESEWLVIHDLFPSWLASYIELLCFYALMIFHLLSLSLFSFFVLHCFRAYVFFSSPVAAELIIYMKGAISPHISLTEVLFPYL